MQDICITNQIRLWPYFGSSHSLFFHIWRCNEVIASNGMSGSHDSCRWEGGEWNECLRLCLWEWMRVRYLKHLRLWSSEEATDGTQTFAILNMLKPLTDSWNFGQGMCKICWPEHLTISCPSRCLLYRLNIQANALICHLIIRSSEITCCSGWAQQGEECLTRKCHFLYVRSLPECHVTWFISWPCPCPLSSLWRQLHL